MDKDDLKEIKSIIDSALETHLASVHEEITDLRTDMETKFLAVDTKFTAVEGRMDRLEAKIDHIDEKLGGFENSEVDKRKQIEVRVNHIEKHLNLSPRSA